MESALNYFQSEYGDVTEVYGADAVTLQVWMEAEPGNTLGYEDVSPGDYPEPICALFLKGTFTVVGPLGPPGTPRPPFAAGYGRVVFTSDGSVLGAALRVMAIELEADDTPGFGATFDDA